MIQDDDGNETSLLRWRRLTMTIMMKMLMTVMIRMKTRMMMKLKCLCSGEGGGWKQRKPLRAAGVGFQCYWWESFFLMSLFYNIIITTGGDAPSFLYHCVLFTIPTTIIIIILRCWLTVPVVGIFLSYVIVFLSYWPSSSTLSLSLWSLKWY